MKRKIIRCVMIFAILFICRQAMAASDLAAMQQSTVHIFAYFDNGSGASGSGFFVGNGGYVATNWHVVKGVQEGAKLMVINSSKQRTPAQVLWSSPEKDLAILKLDNSSMGNPVTFAPRSQVQIGENVYVMGFPGIHDSLDAEVTVTRGIVSRVIKFDNGVSYYQTDAAVNHGNSGGPLFNEQGQVIGIVSMKSVDKEGEIEGIGFAIQCDELLPALSEAGIDTGVTPTTPAPAPSTPQPKVPSQEPAPAVPIQPQPYAVQSPAEHSSGMLLWMGALVILGGGAVIATIVWLSQRNRSSVAVVASPSFTAPARPPIANNAPVQQMQQASQPMLKGLAGQYAGQVIAVRKTPLILGRDPTQADLVFGADISGISRIHCLLSFDNQNRIFWLEESLQQPSRNGTFLSSGERLQPGRRYRLNYGERFYLGTPATMFEVVM